MVEMGNARAFAEDLDAVEVAIGVERIARIVGGEGHRHARGPQFMDQRHTAIARGQGHGIVAAVLEIHIAHRQGDDGNAGLRDPLAPPELIGDYGATSPAEFFAVVTEVFFERAAALAGRHPALFAALRDYFRVDPREWHAPMH